MKTFIAFTATALIIAATFDAAMGMSSYIKELPNGASFSQELGHPDKDSSQYTDFATAFADAGHSWTAELCGATFPGSDMTNGAAFGDPCCTWTKSSGNPDFAVTAFTTTPGEATVCASTADTASSTTEAPETTESPTTEAPTTYAPATTETPSTTAPPSTDAPATTDSPPCTEAPATTNAPVSTDTPATAPSSGGCGVKSENATQNYRRFRH